MEKVAEGRKRKVEFEESEPSTSLFQLKTPRLAAVRDDSSSPPVSEGNSTCESVSSRCISSLNELPAESSKFVDLEIQREDDACEVNFAVNIIDRREKTPSSASNRRFCCTAEKIPSKHEVEEFFSAAENSLRKQFINKYNFDIVKDEPTEGRYEWIKIQIKP